MADREELAAKLGELKKEFDGFPEEQLLTEVIDELSTGSTQCSIPPIDQQVSLADLLRMARHLGKYCSGRNCPSCFIANEAAYLSCFRASWAEDITDDLIRKIEREESEKEESEKEEE